MSDLPGPAAVVTPDAVGLDLDLATIGSRGVAFMVDLLLITVGLFLLILAQALLGGAGFVPGWAGIAIALVFVFVLLVGYPIGFEVMNHGQTPGKMMLGLRVVTVEGGSSATRHATIRAATGLLELFGTTGAIAVISSFASSKGQRLGDMAAGTLVVRDRRRARHGAPTAARWQATPGTEHYIEVLDISGIDSRAYGAIRETLQRAPMLAPPIADGLCDDLAGQLLSRVQPPPPAGLSAEEFLRCLAVAVQRRSDAAGPPPAPTAAVPPSAAAVPSSPATASTDARSPSSPAAAAPVPPPSVAPEPGGAAPSASQPADRGDGSPTPPGGTGGGFAPPA
ncbi:MAG: RDD family protein [Nitriliruptoraceae bacterium]|nr:RDD family protein [Nitriliruptoraceae bacterium]